MQDLKIDGYAKITGGDYGNVSIDGMATCDGDITAVRLTVDGMLKSEGSLDAKTLDCDGMTKVRGAVRAGKMSIDGMLTVRGGKIEADEIECDGLITVNGEISADVIKADGCIDACEITGDSIYIRSRRHIFFPFFRGRKSRIKLIEATTVELRGVESESVNGTNVRIDWGCRIESVDCSGTLWISPGARVKNVSGSCRMADE